METEGSKCRYCPKGLLGKGVGNKEENPREYSWLGVANRFPLDKRDTFRGWLQPESGGVPPHSLSLSLRPHLQESSGLLGPKSQKKSQKCVRNASKMCPKCALFYWKRGTFQNASEMRQKCIKNARNTFGGEHLLDDTDKGPERRNP